MECTGAGQWGEWSLESCLTTDKVPEVSGRTEGTLALESHGFQHSSGTLTPRSSLPQGQRGPVPSGQSQLASLTPRLQSTAPPFHKEVSQTRVVGLGGVWGEGLGTGVLPEATLPASPPWLGLEAGLSVALFG